jgi:alkylation response protein AidB-like acyl-CoA dehydrogenase
MSNNFAPMAARKASSSTSGFFQAMPNVLPQYTASTGSKSSANQEISDDTILPRLLSLYLPEPLTESISTHLHHFARAVLHPRTLQQMVSCDTDPPTLHPLTTFGAENKSTPLRTSEGWRELKKLQTRSGMPGHAYVSSQSLDGRILQYAIQHLWHGTGAVTTCPMAMTDGAAVLLRNHLNDSDGNQPGRNLAFRESYKRLISFDPDYAWTSGQWMTERSGGSDVRGTETVARRMTAQEIQADSDAGRDKDAHGLPLGPWLIDGFKWFSSATDADMAVLLAQTPNGLSAFYAPLRRRVGFPIITKDKQTTSSPSLTTESLTPDASEMNGVRIQRLKSKLGTHGVPTAELELRSMRAYLIGQVGQGVKEISSILNITRLHTASAGVGYLARGLAVSRAYTRVRKIKGGQRLSENAQHLAWMAGETVKYWANVHLIFLGVALLGGSEEAAPSTTTPLVPGSKTSQLALLRLLTPVMKAQTTLNSVSGLRACMESLGGVGYLENNEDGGVLNIARLFRDAVVGTIWEGTTSVMAEDVLRVVKNPKATTGTNVLDETLGTWVKDVLRVVAENRKGLFTREVELVSKRYAVLEKLVRENALSELEVRGREILEHIEGVTCACLLMYDATTDGDEVAVEIARRWIRLHALAADKAALESERRVIDHQKEIEMNRKIFLGEHDALSGSPADKAKL